MTLPPLDPELGSKVAALPPVELTVERLAVIRAAQREAAAQVPLSAAVVRTDHVVDGEPPVPVRVHRPADADAGGRRLPCVLSFHGGGLVVGTHLSDDPLFDQWCPALGVIGVSVDYRLAPEDPYPAALDDAWAVLRWAHANAEELGADPHRIGVRGVSAGGNLAAALAMRVRDEGGPAIAFQLLDAPMLDDRQQTASSQEEGLVVWTRETNAFGWRCYLGALHGSDAVPATAAPARATDLSGLPPAFVSVGAADGFRDEDVDYATRSSAAGVPCELHVYAGVPHGYPLAGDTAALRRARRDMAEWLVAVLGAR